MNDILIVQGSEIRTFEKHSEQFICITDIAKRFGSSDLINDWLKNKNTVDFLGVWERPKLPDIFINRRLNFSCVSFLGLI